MVNQITPGGPPVVPTTSSAQPATVRTAHRVVAGPSPAIAPGVQAAAVAQVNEHLAQSKPELKLQVDAESGRTIFQVIQQGTGQVLLQVPSEEVLSLSRRVRQILSQNSGAGALVDKEG